MRPKVHWIETTTAGRLAIMARPRAGDWLDDEVAGWRKEGIDIVVSLLEPNEVSELNLQRESHLCEEQAIEFISFPIADRGVPISLRETSALARSMAFRVGEGEAVAIHCRAGIGRSALLAACVLVCAGSSPDAAFEKIRKARGVSVPDTEEQRDWVAGFKDAIATAP
jgi:predicted protein tyrosine phosphatase